MAAQRVQAYLDKHKIGALFENLMAKVIQDMPGNPINYLIRVLQKKESKVTGKPVRSEMTSSVSRSSAWAKNDDVNLNAARPKSSKTDARGLATREVPLRKSVGNIRPKTSASAHKLRASTRPTVHQPQSNVSNLTSVSDIHTTSGNVDITDDLNIISHTSKRLIQKEEAGSTTSFIQRSKRNKKAIVDEKRKQLASLLATTSHTIPSPRTHSDSDNVTDEGVDLIEDTDDLLAEGVSSLSSGSGIRKRQTLSTSIQQNVQVSVCSRCARVIDTGKQEVLDDSSVVTVSSNRHGGYASSAVTLADDERDDFFFAQRSDDSDDFESASQVTPHTSRMPRWPTSRGEDNKSPTIQNKARVIPAANNRKGRHMYRREDSAVNAMLSQSGRSRSANRMKDTHGERSSDEWQVFDSSQVHHPDALPSSLAATTSTNVVSGRSEEESGSDVTPRVREMQMTDDGSDSSALWHSSNHPNLSRFRAHQMSEMLTTNGSDSEPQMRSLQTRSNGTLADDEMALKDNGFRGRRLQSDFSQVEDESDDDLSETPRTYTRPPVGSVL
ncbi:uncharacterized protein C8orf34-like isoform X2 [Corticium candelabrum]|uniref:uncharacterized protein C8orf34-like isoform X2 n=1 Tax=Corticium candelabrum TaxID=121492 RepID=UPI002E254471|nr:uncharacterized protein C8orf34-like isoform X2 [Corticium candelabrum]